MRQTRDRFGGTITDAPWLGYRANDGGSYVFLFRPTRELPQPSDVGRDLPLLTAVVRMDGPWDWDHAVYVFPEQVAEDVPVVVESQ